MTESFTPIAAPAGLKHDQPTSHSVDPTRPPLVAWLQPLLIAMLTAAAFIGMYVGLQRDPTPRGIPVAVIGGDLAGQVSAALGDAVKVTVAADAVAGDGLVAGRDVVAVLAKTSPTALTLDAAGANGPSTVGALETLVGIYGRSTGSEVIITDVNPLVRYDSRGTVGFHVAFGVSLASFILAQMLTMSAAFVRSRHHLIATAVFAALVGVMASLLAGPLLGALPGNIVSLAVTLAMLSAATALATMALGAWFGAVGFPIATLLLITVGTRPAEPQSEPICCPISRGCSLKCCRRGRQSGRSPMSATSAARTSGQGGWC